MPDSDERITAGAELTIEPITTVDRWKQIAGDWDRLLRATPSYTGLQSFDFLWVWWQAFSTGRKLWILAFYDGREVVGIAPLQITERRILGKTYRILEFLAMTEDILRPTMLFPAAERPRLLASLMEYLAANADLWDVLELDELAETDTLIASAKQLAGSSRWSCRVRPFHPCPSLDLSSKSWMSYFGKRSAKLRKNVRAAERRLGETGVVGLEVYRASADILRGFATFRTLARASWKHDAQIGMASDARYERFYSDLLGIFARRHGARVLVLTASGTPVAATLAVIFDGVYHSLQIVHDEAYARCSPGTLLEARELETLFNEGEARRYEFMGGALSNKLRWTDDLTQTVCVQLAQPDIRLRALDRYATAKRAARRALVSARAVVAKSSPRVDL